MSSAFETTFKLEPQSYGALTRLYDQAPEFVAAQLVAAVEGGALVAEREVKTRTPRDQSRLANAIGSTITVHEARVVGEVSVLAGRGSGPLEYAVYVEHGTRPGGKLPPIAAIRAWVVRKGLAGAAPTKFGRTAAHVRDYALFNHERVIDEIAWKIAWHLKHHGSKGAFMFRDGAAAAAPEVERLLQAAYVAVLEHLKTGA